MLRKRVSGSVLVVEGLNLIWGYHKAVRHFGLAEGLDDDLFLFDFFEAGERVALGLKSSNEGRAIATEFFADDALNAIVHHMVGDIRPFFLHFPEFLNDQLAVNEILECSEAHFLDFIGKVGAVVGLAHGAFTSPDQFPNLGNRDHLIVNNRSHAVDDLCALGMEMPGA